MQLLDIGDWIYYPNMGAYTSAAATDFNGFEKAKYYYIIDNLTW